MEIQINTITNDIKNTIPILFHFCAKRDENDWLKFIKDQKRNGAKNDNTAIP